MTRNLTLLTDLYQLTMMDGYLKNGKEKDIAVFDLFFRRNNIITYSVAAGLEQALDYVLNIRFEKQDIEYLRSLGLFDETFLSYLKNFRFTGDVYAVPEGTVVFPEEPIVTVRAPLLEAQFLETALLNIVNHQTLIASKSAKVAYAAKGDSVMEFGLRRAQGPDAGIYGARASVIGGCRSTSNVLAGQKFGIPVAGTHAHSWVMNFPTEYEAFFRLCKDVSRCLPAARRYIRHPAQRRSQRYPRLPRAARGGHEPKGIRLDSGDLAYLSKMARAMLDEAGFPDAIICASGDLDEYLINSLKNQGACIDLWGVGTKLITSADMPALGGVYKLSALIRAIRKCRRSSFRTIPTRSPIRVSSRCTAFTTTRRARRRRISSLCATRSLTKNSPSLFSTPRTRGRRRRLPITRCARSPACISRTENYSRRCPL